MACPVCGGMFASRTKFQDHIIRQAAINDNEVQNFAFECGYCYRKFASERLLRDHMRHHVSHYKCPYCAMTCPNPSSLHSHITYRHSTEKNYSCQYCEYRCKYESDLYKHLETHNNEPSFKCPIENCDYSTRTRACLNRHVSGKHQNGSAKVYKCHICEKTFSRGNYLTKHLMSNHHFHWPSGHCRFRYVRDDDGFFRLQMVRYESIELSEAVLQEEGCEENKEIASHSILDKTNLEDKTVVDNSDNENNKEASTELMKSSESNDIQATTVPMVVYIPNPDNKDDTTKEMIPSEVHSVVLEVHNIEDVSASSEVPPYVYLNLSDLEKNGNSSRTIHVIENLDGKTVIQMAEVIASAPEHSEDIEIVEFNRLHIENIKENIQKVPKN
ncbi:histone H4 transcription factor-like [Centruroides sculpturatus]|uniref:histone H4 transcription factor-like n=1 Tax=Centruroides sculpturatus TaxID=218467 RepID=UPI000C6E7705|nr:histone H4 transcription factor-like [Centruroides sculpturatus]